MIVNLQVADRDLQRRMIDFCSGVTYALSGEMEKVADEVFLLAPTNVKVSEEERQRLQERGFGRELTPDVQPAVHPPYEISSACLIELYVIVLIVRALLSWFPVQPGTGLDRSSVCSPRDRAGAAAGPPGAPADPGGRMGIDLSIIVVVLVAEIVVIPLLRAADRAPRQVRTACPGRPGPAVDSAPMDSTQPQPSILDTLRTVSSAWA